jgi:hypothetical protein
MRQLEVATAAVGAGETPSRKQQRRSVSGRLLDAKEAAVLGLTPRAKRPWRWVVLAVLAAFFMIVPQMVILYGARSSAPPIWISTANVLRGGNLS